MWHCAPRKTGTNVMEYPAAFIIRVEAMWCHIPEHVHCPENLAMMNVSVPGQYTYTVHLSFRTDCAERILHVPSGSHPQKHVAASLDTSCA